MKRVLLRMGVGLTVVLANWLGQHDMAKAVGCYGQGQTCRACYIDNPPGIDDVYYACCDRANWGEAAWDRCHDGTDQGSCDLGDACTS